MTLSAQFQAAMRAVPAPVAVITSVVDGRPYGLTVSSVVSTSIEPPRLLQRPTGIEGDAAPFPSVRFRGQRAFQRSGRRLYPVF